MSATLLLAVVGARITADELAHYSFSYQQCASASSPRRFTDTLNAANAARRLTIGPGLTCMDGHLGAQLNISSDCTLSADTCPTGTSDVCTVNDPPPSNPPQCAFDPALSGCGGFAAGFTAGFTIEAWLTADPNFDHDRVILALSSRCPLVESGLDEDDYCKQGKELSLIHI